MKTFTLGFIMRKEVFILTSVLLVLNGCGGSGSALNTAAPTQPEPPPAPVTPDPPVQEGLIKLNQLGFLPNAKKVAIIPGEGEREFIVVNTVDNSQVMAGSLSSHAVWAPSQEQVSQADFSQVTSEGSYRLDIVGSDLSAEFVINENALGDVHDAALKSYYFNRATAALEAEYADKWSRPMGHPDEQVLVHTSASSTERPAGFQLSAPKGWYDAGDYNKYIVNSGISTYTLMISYLHHSAFYQQRDIGIPESNDAIPDILNEVKWNLDWIQAMQDPNDGGVYHKLTTLNFSGELMPHEANAQRYVVQKSTAATLNFSAVMAVASRVYSPYFPELAQEYARQAELAWEWAQANENVPYVQPDDVSTGQYGDTNFNDEFAWAAAELYLMTEKEEYLQRFNQLDIQPTVPGWPDTSSLGYISLLTNNNGLLSDEQLSQYQSRLVDLASGIVALHQESAYQVAMQNNDFVWGSNSVALNKALILLQAFRLTENTDFKHAANGLLDYVLGRNPTDYSYVTGCGTKSPMDIHHRQSRADEVTEPVPGFVAGGAQNGQQDGCSYPSDLPATSYVDDWCSYSTNEIAINWNAPLVYVLAGMQAEN